MSFQCRSIDAFILIAAIVHFALEILLCSHYEVFALSIKILNAIKVKKGDKSIWEYFY